VTILNREWKWGKLAIRALIGHKKSRQEEAESRLYVWSLKNSDSVIRNSINIRCLLLSQQREKILLKKDIQY
jgi:hypothetical protein